MSTTLILALASFLAGMAFAFVVGGWRDAVDAAARPVAEEEGEEAGPVPVSLVIPARDAARTIVPLLQDLYAQQWPKELLEVIVVDDGSTDGMAAVVQGMGRTWPGLRLVAAAGEGKKAAITAGVAAAHADWILLTDADGRCGPLRVRKMMQAVQAMRPDMLLMPVATVGEGLLQGVQAEEQAALLAVAVGTAAQGRPMLANGANMAFSKAAFQAVGGYAGDTWASGDDIFLLQRMRAHGRRIEYLLDPDVVVTVQAEDSFRGFWRQRLRWAGKMRGVPGPLGSIWPALAGMLLPWFLLGVSCSITVAGLMRQRPLTIMLLLAAAWMLWLLPVLSLVRAVRGFLQAAIAVPRRRGRVLSTLFALVAFSLYAPVIALASLVARPVWKGRRV